MWCRLQDRGPLGDVDLDVVDGDLGHALGGAQRKDVGWFVQRTRQGVPDKSCQAFVRNSPPIR